MLNWYRALRAGSMEEICREEIKVPVRMLWGEGDTFLSLALAKDSMKMCKDGELTIVGEATHWVQHEQASIVNRLIRILLQKEL
ncbi:MAG: alpha/beta hydrolase [Bacillus sp. (in: Bacteria)]|nr:alpha/beta hydrolase [Bacillus sp. (in: firmicutes)]